MRILGRFTGLIMDGRGAEKVWRSFVIGMHVENVAPKIDPLQSRKIVASPDRGRSGWKLRKNQHLSRACIERTGYEIQKLFASPRNVFMVLAELCRVFSAITRWVRRSNDYSDLCEESGWRKHCP
jgi:hypothetical protein